MRTLSSSICTLCFLTLFMQAGKQHPTSSAPPKISFACPDAEAKGACQSLREMANAKDKDILSLVDGNGDYKYSYACFLKKDDEFFVVSFTQEQSKVFWEEKDKQLVDSLEMFQYAKFKNGVSDDYKLLNLTWRKRLGTTNAEATGEATDVHNSEKPAHVLIDESEIGLTYSFKNVSGVDTDVNIQIRRSTLKYVMTFSVEKDHVQFSELGSCVKLASPKA